MFDVTPVNNDSIKRPRPTVSYNVQSIPANSFPCFLTFIVSVVEFNLTWHWRISARCGCRWNFFGRRRSAWSGRNWARIPEKAKQLPRDINSNSNFLVITIIIRNAPCLPTEVATDMANGQAMVNNSVPVMKEPSSAIKLRETWAVMTNRPFFRERAKPMKIVVVGHCFHR